MSKHILTSVAVLLNSVVAIIPAWSKVPVGGRIDGFNIYSEDYISIFGFETNFNDAFTQLVACKDIVLKGRCRKE